MTGTDDLARTCLRQRDRRLFREDFRQQALVRRVQMLDQDKGHARVGRNGAQKFGHCLETAGRSPDSHHKERVAAVSFWQAGAQGRARLLVGHGRIF